MSGVPTYDAIKIPSHVKTVLITGAGGFVGQKLTQLLLKYAPQVKIITTDIAEPPKFVNDENKLRCVKTDLGKVENVKALFEGEKIGLIYALHGIMSGGSESNFDLGYAVNVDSNVLLLKQAYAHAQQTGQVSGDEKLTYVFVSSLAVYGGPKCKPTDKVIPKDTPVISGTSYGVEKTIVELYVYDYGRKGYLNTRSVRLPSVCIRSGAPSTAASSFVSGLIREPLQGIRTTMPLCSSATDPQMDSYPHYCTKVSTVIRNIAYAGIMPESKFEKGWGRSINLPGVSVKPSQMLAAVKKYGGDKALGLIDYKIDSAVQAICDTWAGDYDSSASQAMGFEVDSKELGYGEAVEEFMEELKAAK